MPRMSTNAHRSHQAGFTLVEIAVIAPIMMLVIIGLVALLLNLVSQNLAARAEMSIIHNAHSALTTIEDDIKLTSRFLPTIDQAFSDPYGPTGTGGIWSIDGSGGDARTLITRTYATTRSLRDPLRQPVYINEQGCTQNVILGNPALTANIIYFVQDNNLYRRTLTRTDLSTCSPQFQRQTCPANLAQPQAICQANDSLLMEGISGFRVSYYTANGNQPINAYGSSDPNILQNAQTAEVTIEVQKSLSGRQFNMSRTIRVTKLNE